MFLCIENKGVAAVEAFTILGLSTARGNADKIGQFGSGNKHGILTLMRAGINPGIFLGKDKLEFATEKGNMGGKAFDRLIYSHKGNVERLSMVMEFGAIDWDSTAMALREFVSNAIDNADNQEYKVFVSDKSEAKEGFTRVVVPLTPDVNKFYSGIAGYFLHFAHNGELNKQIMQKESGGKGRIYRKGVFIRETKDDALFDYNFGEDLPIDECRKLDEYSVRANVGKMYSKATVETLKLVFAQFGRLENYFEGKLDEYYMLGSTWNPNQNFLKNAVEAFKALYGEAAIANKTQTKVVEMATRKGHKVVLVEQCWYNALEKAGIKTVTIVADERMDKGGRLIKDATAALVARVMKIWAKLEKGGFTNGKALPAIKMFQSVMTAESECFGYYKDNTVFIHEDYLTNKQTILEELAHHITGATDNSRDFQDYAFKVASYFMK
jgi:hypothetical protein